MDDIGHVSGAETFNLVLAGVTREDVGAYTCVVTSSDGCPPLTILGGTISFVDPECAETAQVTPLSPVTVATCAGREIVFEAQIAGTAFHWLHDGQVLTDGALASGAVVSGASTGVLTISNATTSESGSYGVAGQGVCGPFAAADVFEATVAASCCPADFNGDAMVDDADFVVFVGAYNMLDCADPAMAYGCPYDVTGDGMVDDSDFVVFVAAYNELVCS